MRTGTRVVLDGMVLIDRFFEVPLDYAKPTGEQIEVFVREVVPRGREADTALPYLVYFQGGPGFPSPRPTLKKGWLGEALKTHRVLLLDQRGTGLSSRVLTQTLLRRGNAEAQARYLTHFRADNIVRDAEVIRRLLCQGRPWLGTGQSFGGFCLLTYLSFAPEALSGVMIYGGVAGVKRSVREHYRLTYQAVREKNAAFYARYPDDEAKALEILERLRQDEVRLPSGAILTPRRFQQLGLLLGMSGGFESLHYLLESAFIGAGEDSELAYDFLVAVEREAPFETNPFYALLHEAIYAAGDATNWAAEALREEFPDFSLEQPSRVMFTGEMVVPSMFEDYPVLRPLKEAAQLLAEKADWGPLYDLDQLARNEVPVVAISYFEDMFVPIEWSRETARHLGRCDQWVTNEWEHNGIHVDGVRIFSTLLVWCQRSSFHNWHADC